MARSTTKKPYHHGDLRPALLRAVEELVTEQGIENISLRECARRAGVSWSAPGHHFGDKTGMLTAFAAEGFVALCVHMAKRRDAASGPMAASIAVGEGYLEFALTHPGHFRVMFRTELVNPSETAYRAESSRAFNILRDSMRLCRQSANQRQDPHLEKRCLLAWSTVHGLATLLLERAIPSVGRSAKTRLKHDLELGRELLGLLSPALFPAP